MKCVIPSQNANIFARAIHAFGRIGSELFLEATNNGLSIRTVNTTKSAYASLTFQPAFFNEYTIADSNDVLSNVCKLSLKSCLGVFKNMRQVETCILTLNTDTLKFIVQLKCRLETVKTHYVSILEQESLQACYVKDQVPNILVAAHKLFSDIVTNFKSNEEELTLAVDGGQLVAKNYLEGSKVDHRFVRSQLTLRPEEFDGYHITKDTSITFCMRELRALLSFTEILNMNVSAQFETPGKPIVFILKDIDVFEANLVMSTLTPEAINFCASDESAVSDDQRLHISTGTTANASESIPSNNNTVKTKEAQRKRARSSLVTPADVARNHATNDHGDDGNRLFQFDQIPVSDSILRKRRRTSTPQSTNGADVPETNDLATPDIYLPPRVSVPPSCDNLLPNLSNEHINVEFAESESIQVDECENQPNRPNRIRRDHGIVARNMVSEMMSSPLSMSFGETFVEGSDEE